MASLFVLRWFFVICLMSLGFSGILDANTEDPNAVLDGIVGNLSPSVDQGTVSELRAVVDDARKQGRGDVELRGMHVLAQVLKIRQEYGAAADVLTERLAIVRAKSSSRYLEIALTELAQVCRLAARYDESEKHWKEYLALAGGRRPAGSAMALGYEGLAGTYRDAGRLQDAVQQYRNAIDSAAPDDGTLLDALLGLADVMESLGKPEQAHRYRERADAVRSTAPKIEELPPTR